MPSIEDYRALIQDRRQKDRRQPVRYPICLDPELFTELEEAEQDLRDERVDSIGDDGEPKPGVDLRMGALSAVAKAELRVAEVEQRIADASILGVFKPFTSAKMAERIDQLTKEQEDNPGDLNVIMIRSSRATILDSFDHFEGPGRERLDLTREDLESMIDTWSFGEIFGLANKINAASTQAHDAPKSVRSSLLNRHSAAT